MKSVTLYYREGKSDKVYQAVIEPSGNLFVVTFAYGRRGSTLQTGIKTPSPVDLSTAEQVFDKLVREKQAKGYTIGESGVPYAQTENANRDTGIRPQLLNAIDEDVALQFAESPLWCLQEKMDGRRLLVKKEGAEIQGINRRGLVVSLPSSIVSALQKIVGDFILDGECVGETFHAFDLLSLNEREWARLPYRDRLLGVGTLLQYADSAVTVVETAYDTADKLAAFKGFKECRAEGVVFKLLSEPYNPGRPERGGPAVKHKFTTTGSFIVGAHNQSRSVGLKLFREKNSCGNVTIPPNREIPKVGTVVEVRYLYAFHGGSLYQPVYLGARDDIAPSECVANQLKFKREEADDDGE